MQTTSRLPHAAFIAFALLLGVFAADARAHRIFFVDPGVAQSGDGTTWRTAFKTLNEGILASDGDDQLFLAPGVYQPVKLTNGVKVFGGLVPPRANIFLRQPLATRVIFDGGGQAPVITMDTGCEINGIWVVNGRGGTAGGGGVRISGNANFVSGCVFLNCGAAAGTGAAIQVAAGSSPVIENCIFAYNVSGPTVWCSGGNPEFVNNLFYQNAGDSIQMNGTGFQIIANNSFVQNLGRGVDLPQTATAPLFENNHFHLNAALARRNGVDLSTLAAVNALSFAKENIDGPPRFIDAANFDFDLRHDSPLIDHGHDNLLYSFLDFNQRVRPYNDPRIQGPRSARDIGPFEWAGTEIRASGTSKPGTRVTIDLMAPNDPGKFYAVAASFGVGPMPIDFRDLYLTFDNLMVISLTNAWPQIFQGFAGQFDAAGRAQAAVRLPNVPSLVGQRFFLAMVVLSPMSRSNVALISRTIPVEIK